MYYYDKLESMICGDLMPHKVTEDLRLGFHLNEFIIGSDPYGYIIYTSKYYKRYIDEIPNDEIALANVSFDNKVLQDLTGHTWYPPTRKAFFFLIMIDIEKSQIMDQYKSFYNDEVNLNNTRLQINKEIRRVNVLATELKAYADLQLISPNEFDIRNPIHYIIFLLQETLIDLLGWIYKMYNDLSGIKVINPKELRSKLFEEASACSSKEQVQTWEMANKIFQRNIEKIFERFNNELFTCNDLDDFYNVFRYETIERSSLIFMPKSKSKFYYLLHLMWHNKETKISRELTSFTKESYFKPILKNCNLSFNSFGNKDKISDTLGMKHSQFKEIVDTLFE